MRNDNQKRIMKQKKKWDNYKKCSNKHKIGSCKGVELEERIDYNQKKKKNLFAFISVIMNNKKKKASKSKKR